LYRQAVEIITDKRVLPKDRVAANDVATKLVRAMDEQQGLLANDRVTIAALSETVAAFVRMAEMTGNGQLFTALMAQSLKGTQAGQLILGMVANNTLYINEAESEEETDGENEGDITDKSTPTSAEGDILE
jgi:hypothetical protein